MKCVLRVNEGRKAVSRGLSVVCLQSQIRVIVLSRAFANPGGYPCGSAAFSVRQADAHALRHVAALSKMPDWSSVGKGLNERLLQGAESPADKEQATMQKGRLRDAVAQAADIAGFQQSRDAMLRSRIPTRFVIGKLLEEVMNDGKLDEKDLEFVQDFLTRQQEVWNQIMVVSVLMVSFTFGETHTPLSAQPGTDERFGDELGTAYVVAISAAHVMFVASVLICGLLYAYSKLIYDLHDIVWFFTTAPHQLPIVTMMSGLALYFVSGTIAAPLVHGPVLGGMLAAMWVSAIIALCAMYLALKSRMMARWTGAGRLEKTISSRTPVITGA